MDSTTIERRKKRKIVGNKRRRRRLGCFSLNFAINSPLGKNILERFY
jgi:hypothetical protein